MEQIETIGATEQRELTRIRISVRNLVEFIFRSGDIDNRIGKGAQKEAMQEGSRMHRKIQGRMGMEYRAEVPLKLEVPQEQYALALYLLLDHPQMKARESLKISRDRKSTRLNSSH